MASVFKKGRDKNRKGSCWYFSYDDENGKRCTKRGFTEKRATEQLALETEAHVRRCKQGLLDPATVGRQTHAETSIGEHLDAFELSLAKNTSKHAQLTVSRIRRLVEKAKFHRLSDIDADSVEAAVSGMLNAEMIGRKTYNHYLQAMNQFCNWLVPKRLAANPLLGLRRLNAEADIRYQRRALKPDEFQKLVKSARDSGVSIQCFDGETRARIYILSYMTGLRRKEIASLTPASFRLDSTPPTLTVAATASKHRKKDTLPLHPALVGMLKVWLAGLSVDEPLFPLLDKRRTWLMVKLDLERVQIPYLTSDGVADFHAAGRHTHITELLRNGASLPEARELARNSDIRTTMKYTHIGIDDQAKAVSQLPWVEPTTESNSEGQETTESESGSGQRRGSGELHPEGQSVSSSDTENAAKGAGKKRENPGVNRGSCVSMQRLSPVVTNIAKVEAAGFEPASRDISVMASTCVFTSLVLTNQDSR